MNIKNELKDELNYVKEELSSDEKLLENAFKLERIYNKHKVKIWAVVVLVVIGFGGKALMGVYHEHQLAKANNALVNLINNPNDKESLQELKNYNPKLYNLYTYSKAVDKKDIKTLENISNSDDTMLSDLSKYHINILNSKAGNSKYYSDLSAIEKAYEALKAGNKSEAKTILAMISENSPVAGVAKYLKHYTLTDNTKAK